MFTSKIDIQHVNLEFYQVHCFLEFKKTPSFTLNTAVMVFHFKYVNLLMLRIGLWTVLTKRTFIHCLKHFQAKIVGDA